MADEKLALQSAVVASPSDRSSTPESICEVQDILAEIIQYLSPINLFSLGLTCRKFVGGYCWAFVRYIDFHSLHGALTEKSRAEFLRDRSGPKRALECIRSNSRGVRSIRLVVSAAENERALMSPLLDHLLPQLNSISISSSNGITSIKEQILPRLNRQAVLHLRLYIWLQEPSVDQFFWPNFRNLKVLGTQFSDSLFVPAMELVASNLQQLEYLSIGLEKSPTRENILCEDSMGALSRACQANRATLKRLSVVFVSDPRLLFSLIIETATRNGFVLNGPESWAKLDEVVRARFVVPLSGLRAGYLSMWLYHTQKFPDTELYQLSSLFDLCYGSEMTEIAARTFCDVVCQRAIGQPQNLDYIMQKVIRWLSSSWLWTAYSILALRSITKIVDHMHELASLPHEKDSLQKYIHQVVAHLRELVNLWPQDTISNVLSPALLTLVLEADPDWANQKKFDFSSILILRLGAVVKNLAAFKLILHYGDPELGLRSWSVMAALSKLPDETTKLEGWRQFMLFYRKHPEFIRDIIGLSPMFSTVNSWLDDPRHLGHLLAALVLNTDELMRLFTYQLDKLAALIPVALDC